MTETQAAATRFCARVVGPFLVVLGLLFVTRYETLPMILPALMQDAPLVLVTGFWTLILGLIMYTAHHHLGSPAAVTLTVIALILILRGTLLILLPEALITIAAQMVRIAPVMMLTAALVIGVGAWLSYVGWTAKAV